MFCTPVWVPEWQDMPAIGRPDNLLGSPYSFRHRGRNDDIVLAREGENWTSKAFLSGLCVPMHQPIEAFPQPRDIQRSRIGKV